MTYLYSSSSAGKLRDSTDSQKFSSPVSISSPAFAITLQNLGTLVLSPRRSGNTSTCPSNLPAPIPTNGISTLDCTFLAILDGTASNTIPQHPKDCNNFACSIISSLRYTLYPPS
eukprot:NODE_5_length_72347_cov_1.339331.p54 type:complete len:115 gc:universal NODE_5_length_72347_cov_1.339331:67297-66953(-)